MKNKIFYRWMIVSVILLLLPGAGDATMLPAPIEKARILQSQGKYLEARKEYEQILNKKNSGLSRKEFRKILKEYENVNIKLLFSKKEMPGSVFHTVVPGDSLSKIAKKYKTTPALIKRSNSMKNNTVKLGTKLKVINGTFSVRVNKTKNILVLYLNGKAFKHYKVATGTENGTPTGKFKITSREENPVWYKAGGIVPPGSTENQLGTRWLGFDYPGYGIHGTTEPQTIGQHVTSGCVRMLNTEVEELFDIIPLGAEVVIVG